MPGERGYGITKQGEIMRYLPVVLLIALFVIGCGGARTTDLTPEANRETVDNIPDWFLNPPFSPEQLSAAGSMTSRDLQMAVTKARTQALAALAQQLSANLSSLTKQFREEVGVGDDSELLDATSEAIKAVTDQTVNGARVTEKEVLNEGPIYRAYVLMSLPMGDANRALMEQIRSNDRLRTEFRASKAFQALEAEVSKN